MNLKPNEEFEVIVLNDSEILLRRKAKNPLEVLIGKGEREEILPEKVDELSEE
ncbi:AbrB family transcriptional regulator [Sulfurisphaera ohwakuensis]|uniref:AbrB family transcriptional regulator n=1 Tax=Sulfurisphaera ohwakuensis TaxID=69656 RepID=UPI001E4EC3A0|nr:AbrB family transcriptional regulator [Sulfurisphaera ohwakuensis]